MGRPKYSDVTMLNLLLQLLQGLIFKCIRLVHWFIQEKVWWRINGTTALIDQAKKCVNYSRAAHVLTIRWRYNIEPSFGNSISDFVLKSDNFVSPDIVFQDNVTLYYIDMDKAVFIETEKNIHVWQRECGTFYSDMQYHHAKRVVVIYKSALKELLKKLEENVPRLVIIAHVGRCGSTLLGQLFECTEKCVTFCEPSVIDSLNWYWSTTAMPREEVDELALTTVKLLCKPIIASGDVLAYVIKLKPLNFFINENFDRLFKERCSHLFVYRNLLDSARSTLKIQHRLPNFKLALLAEKIPGFFEFALRQKSPLSVIPALKFQHSLGLGIRVWFVWLQRYQELRRKNVLIAAVRYEDLISKSIYALKKIFDHCNIPTDTIQLAARAYEADAQKNSRLSMTSLAHFTVDQFPNELVKECNRICTSLDLPPVDGDCIIEGVITQ